MALTDKEIEALQPREKRYKVTDRDGLYLLPDVGVADSNCPFRGHGRADYSRRNDPTHLCNSFFGLAAPARSRWRVRDERLHRCALVRSLPLVTL